MYMHKLDGYLHEKKISRVTVCKELNLSEPTLRRYIRCEGFSIAQVKQLSKLLGINNPEDIYDIFLN